MNARKIHDDDQLFLLSDGQVTEFIVGVENHNYVLITDDQMVTTESLAYESIENYIESFSKEMTGLWHELSILEQRLEAQRINVQSIKTQMNGNEEVLEHRGIVVGTGEYLTQSSSPMKGEEVFHSRRQEGVDDWVAVKPEQVRTEISIEARRQQMTVPIEKLKAEQTVLAQQRVRNQQLGDLLD